MDWPQIPLDKEVLVVGREPSCDLVVHHITVSRKHFRLFRENEQWFVEDLDSKLGISVRGVGVRRAKLTEGDVFRFGGSPLYRFRDGALMPDIGGSGMSVTIRDLKIEGDSVNRGEVGKNILLQGINLEIFAGEFIGIIGPSGAGKSILLECLSAQRRPSEGQILMDDQKDLFSDIGSILPQIGSVPQQELIYPFLTVDENLTFAARLRLNVPEETLVERVESVLEQIDMGEHRHKRSGLLSGGQQKRVNIGIELLRERRLLLLDEPTSGLDPGLAGNLMDRLRLLSRRNLTVVCSTHTLDTVHYFDRVIVVGKRDGVGNLAYFGPPAEMLDYFNVRDTAALFKKLHFLPSSEGCGESETTESRKNNSSAKNPRDTSLKIASAVNQSDAPWKSGQTRVILQRTLLGILRDGTALSLSVGILPLVLSFLVVLSQNDQTGGIFIHFFLVVCALWMGMNLSVRELVRERASLDPCRPMLSVFFRDHLAGVRPNCHLAGKFFAFVPVVALQTLLVTIYSRAWIAVIISESTHEATRRPLLTNAVSVEFLILFLTGIAGLTLGFVISSLANSERQAVTTLPLLVLPQLLLSRVAFGHGTEGWNVSSPFFPLASLGDDTISKAFHFTGWLTGGLSLPMVTRPATVAMEFKQIGNYAGTILTVEWLYFFILLAGYGLLLQWSYDRSIRIVLHNR